MNDLAQGMNRHFYVLKQKSMQIVTCNNFQGMFTELKKHLLQLRCDQKHVGLSLI